MPRGQRTVSSIGCTDEQEWIKKKEQRDGCKRWRGLSSFSAVRAEVPRAVNGDRRVEWTFLELRCFEK